MARLPTPRPPGIGARVQEERIRLGLSQASFGDLCGVKKTAQFHYESGERSPDAIYLAAADCLGADVLYIVTGRRSIDVPAPTGLTVEELTKKIMVSIRHVIAQELGRNHVA